MFLVILRYYVNVLEYKVITLKKFFSFLTAAEMIFPIKRQCYLRFLNSLFYSNSRFILMSILIDFYLRHQCFQFAEHAELNLWLTRTAHFFRKCAQARVYLRISVCSDF